MTPDDPASPEPALAGGTPDFDTEYRRQLPALLSWARGQIPPPLHAALSPEDLVQEVWYRAVKCEPAYDATRGSFRRWIFGVARYTLLDALRRAARRQPVETGAVPLSQWAEAIPERVTTASQKASRDESLRAFAEWVRTRLGPDERRLLLMRGFEARELEDIGKELGLEAATLQKRWSRLRARVERFPCFSALALEP